MSFLSNCLEKVSKGGLTLRRQVLILHVGRAICEVLLPGSVYMVYSVMCVIVYAKNNQLQSLQHACKKLKESFGITLIS